MFFLVVIRKGDKFNDDEWISLLKNFLWFLGVEIKQCENKIRLPAESLGDAKNTRSESCVFARFPLRNLLEAQLFKRGAWMARVVALAPGHITVPAAG